MSDLVHLLPYLIAWFVGVLTGGGIVLASDLITQAVNYVLTFPV